MKLHSLKTNARARHARKRVGRGNGSGTGKTAGRGQKGQLSRAGYSRKPGFEGGQMRYVTRVPKRGFTSPRGKNHTTVNVCALERFEDGSVVDAEILEKTGLARGASSGVKILGDGELKRKLTVRAEAFTPAAREKIEAAGGKCETV